MEYLEWVSQFTIVNARELLVASVVIVFAFTIFGMVGFGTALVASPILALIIPIPKIIPMLALMDFVAAIFCFLKNRKNANSSELKRLIPLMIVGSLFGAFFLLNLHSKILILLLSIFAIAYSIYSLFLPKSHLHFKSIVVIPFGFVGGIFSALFGSGGFLYAIYLNGRLTTKDSIRVTLSVLLSLSTLTRAIIFLAAGVYSDLLIPITALILLIPMGIGLYIGRHITFKMSPDHFKRLINYVVLVSGIILFIDFCISNRFW